MPKLLESGLFKLPLFGIKVAQCLVHSHCQTMDGNLATSDVDMEKIPKKKSDLPKDNEILAFVEKLPGADELENILKCTFLKFKVKSIIYFSN